MMRVRKVSTCAWPWVLVAIAALALGLRLLALDRHSLWFDEALEYTRAAGPLRVALLGQPGDQDPPLYALLIHVWLKLGTSEWWLRLPSVLLGTTTVLLAGLWSGRHFGRTVGTLTALLLAVAPVQILYAQELNQYAALIALTLVCLLAFERLTTRGTNADWAIYTLVSALGLGAHYGMIFPLAALGLVLLRRVAVHGSARERRWLIGYLAICAATLAGLWLLGLDQQITISPVQRRWGGTHLDKELNFIGDVGWREILVFFLLPYSGGPALWLVAALSIIAAMGALHLWRSNAAGRFAVGILFFATLALTYLTSIFGLYPLGYRYGLFASPPFFIALAAGMAWVIRRSTVVGWSLAGATLAVFVAFAPYGLWPNPWMSIPREEMRPVVRDLWAHLRPDDVIYVYTGAEPAFRYYSFGNYRRGSTVSVLRGAPFDARSVDGEAARIAAAAHSHGRVWVVLSHVYGKDDELLESALARSGFEEMAEIAHDHALARSFRPGPARQAGARSPDHRDTSRHPR